MAKNDNPVFKGSVENGKLRILNADRFRAYMTRLNGFVEVVVKPIRRKRTLPQNAYYWGVVVEMIRAEVGYLTKEEAHDALRMNFLMDRTRLLPTIRSTTTLSTLEFGEYIEQVRTWAAEFLNLPIPDPTQIDYVAVQKEDEGKTTPDKSVSGDDGGYDEESTGA